MAVGCRRYLFGTISGFGASPFSDGCGLGGFVGIFRNAMLEKWVFTGNSSLAIP